MRVSDWLVAVPMTVFYTRSDRMIVFMLMMLVVNMHVLMFFFKMLMVMRMVLC